MSIAEGRIERGDWAEAVERAEPGWLVLFASWARIEPERGRYDDAEVTAGRRALLAARKKGVEPVVVLHAGALPDWQLAREGWLDPDALAAWGCYADHAAHHYGELLRYWVGLWEPLSEAAWYEAEGKRVARLLLDAQAAAWLHLRKSPGPGGRIGAIGLVERWGASTRRVWMPGMDADPADALVEVLATGKLKPPFGAMGELPNGTPAVDWVGVTVEGDAEPILARTWTWGRSLVLVNGKAEAADAAARRGQRVIARVRG